jgi:hypothetical protein
MSDDNSTQSKQNLSLSSELVKSATELCNELDELVALHHFFYQAVEQCYGGAGLSFRRGLSLFPSWLRERDLDALEALHNLQGRLRKVVQSE